MSRARAARTAGDPAEVLSALREAVTAALAEEDPWAISTAAWRFAKAELDFGAPDRMLEALDVLQRDGRSPFGIYPQASDGWFRLAAAFQDRMGYREARLDALWRAWLAAHSEDAYAVARGEIAYAWVHAARGDGAALHAICDRYERMTPETFGETPTRHPDSKELGSSLWWIWQSLAHAKLWGAVWAGSKDAAQEAQAWWEEAGALNGVHEDPWWAQARAAAVLRFGGEPVYLGQPSPAHPVFSPLARGLLAGMRGDGAAPSAFVEAAEAALAGNYGPEWAGTGYFFANHLAPDEALSQALAETAARYGLGLNP